MIFSIGSPARARVILFSVQKFQFSVQTSNQFLPVSPAHAGIDPVQVLVDDSYGRFPRTRGDRPRVCLGYGPWLDRRP